MFRHLLFTAAITAGLSGAATANESDFQPGTLTVTGEASITIPNTSAVVDFGVQTRRDTPGEAIAENNLLLGKAFAELEALGVPESNIETGRISLKHHYDKIRDSYDGYTLSNIVRVNVDDLEILGDVLTKVTEAGVNWINFSHMAPAKNAVDYDELRRLAAADARDKAQLYTEALGVDIVGILSISESNQYSPVRMERAMAKAEMASMPIAGGDSSPSIRVNVTYLVDLPGLEFPTEVEAYPDFDTPEDAADYFKSSIK